MRPGTTYVGSADDHDNRVREIPFVKSLTAQAGIELSDALLRIWGQRLLYGPVPRDRCRDRQ